MVKNWKNGLSKGSIIESPLATDLQFGVYHQLLFCLIKALIDQASTVHLRRLSQLSKLWFLRQLQWWWVFGFLSSTLGVWWHTDCTGLSVVQEACAQLVKQEEKYDMIMALKLKIWQVELYHICYHLNLFFKCKTGIKCYSKTFEIRLHCQLFRCDMNILCEIIFWPLSQEHANSCLYV